MVLGYVALPCVFGSDDLLLTNASGEAELLPGDHSICVRDGVSSQCVSVVV